MNELAMTPDQKTAGRFESALLKLFTRSVSIAKVDDMGGDTFRLITLEGAVLREVSWTPGDKLQVQLGGWTQRTYTPISWDRHSGSTTLLAYLHGDGPGSRWAAKAKVGDACTVFGPRKSIRLAKAGTVLLFGDETSIGLAAALASRGSPGAVYALLEVEQTVPAAAIAQRLGLENVALYARQPGEAHFAELETRLADLLALHQGAEVVLTGRASSIQRINRLLRLNAGPSEKCHKKVYWADGKVGLD